MLWNAPPVSPVGARSHMLLRVEAEGRGYLCDVGFGGNVLTAPLAWETGVEQKTPHEPHRISLLNDGPFDNGYVLEAFVAGAWVALYRFTAEPQFHSDYEVSNWFLCTHESSFFRHTLLAARATPECRYALRNDTLAMHRAGGTEKRVMTDVTELRAVLAGEMGIRLPGGAELDAALGRILISAQSA